MTPRETAHDLERSAAALDAPGPPRRGERSEPLAMLRRRGFDPRPSRPDLPFDPRSSPERLEAIAALLRHYAFRLFLRGAIQHRTGFAPAQASRYVTLAKAREMAEGCVATEMAARLPGGRYRLVRPVRSFGATLEWWLARELAERLSCPTAFGVRSGAAGVGGDLDVVAAMEGKLVYVEAKSSPPKHVTVEEIAAFLQRVRTLRPDVTLFAVDTALRLSDKILPLFADALARDGAPPLAARRLFRETWALTPHLFLVNAKEDLIENAGRAIAEGLRALGPPPP